MHSDATSLVIEISFVASAPPASAFVADYWSASWLLRKTSGKWAFPEPVVWKHTQKAICNKYGFKNPQKLRNALQEFSGWISLRGLRCCGCECDLSIEPVLCASRQSFEDFTFKLQSHCFCEPCFLAYERAEAIRAEEERQRLASQKEEEKRQNAERRAKLRERFSDNYYIDCPKCAYGILYFRRGRFPGSVFVSCSSYPHCDHREPNPVKLPAVDAVSVAKARIDYENARKCPKCEAPLAQRNGCHGPFIGCTGYPSCKYTENIPVMPPSDEEIIGRFE